MKHLHLAVAALAVLPVIPAALPLIPAAHAASMMSMAPAKPKNWTVGDIVVSGAYARATLPNAPVGGGFFTITNKGNADDTLVSASSPAAGSVQLHDMEMEGGVMRMRPLADGITIPAGKTVALAPNGLHLMFTQLKQRFEKGKSVVVTLTFAKAGTLTVELPVGDVGANAPPGASAPAAPNAMGGMKM
jgi:copper(I)-binding protein